MEGKKRKKKFNETSLQRKVILFSAVFFLFVMVGGVIAFALSMRQNLYRSSLEEILRIVETRKSRFEGSFNSQISLAIQMAESPLISAYFQNPQNRELEGLAMQEFSAYRRSFSGNNIFWINDTDRRYFFNGEYVYTLNPTDSESAWYLPALNMGSRFEFNVNYDLGLRRTLCWINAPVHDSNGRAIGICGTGLDLTDYINLLFSGYSSNISLYIFNGSGEITGAENIALLEEKTQIGEHLGDVGIMAQREGRNLTNEEIASFSVGNVTCAISRISRLDWYILAITPITPAMYIYNTMTAIFFILLLIVFLIFFIFNIFIINTLSSVQSVMDMTHFLSFKQTKTSKSLNVRQRIFVVFSFVIIVCIAWIAASFTLRQHLSHGAREMLHNTELTIQSNLREPETVTRNVAFSIRELVRNGADKNDILDYLILSTEHMETDETVYGFYGLYGHLFGEFLDGSEWVPPDGYVAQERPWYIVAMNAAGNIAETQPYVDAQTGEIVISYSTQVFDHNDSFLGVLAIDVTLNRIAEFAESIKLAENGYGVLLNSDFEIFAHPQKDYLGMKYDTLSGYDAEISALLRSGQTVNAFQRTSKEGIREIVFFTKMENGWYLGLFAPSRLFYRDIYNMVIILVIVGSLLTVILLFLLNSLQRKVEISTNATMELNKSTIRFVPTQFIEYLGVNDITKMELGNCRKGEISIMFFDVRFFSIHSQIMSLSENFEFINKVFGISGPIIREHGGFIDKYIGDAAMALFEKPVDAVRAGIAVYRSLVLDERTRIKLGLYDRINIGIGLHYGSVMLGVIGDDMRYSSTVISEHVNMASRIEGLTKQIKAGMLISADTMQSINEEDQTFSNRYLGLVKPALTNDIIGLYEILDALPDETRKKRMETRELFESGVRNFHTMDYKKAAHRFYEVAKKDNTDKCAILYFEEAKRHCKDSSLQSVFVYDVK
ncbi:MAG: adenylate/guanylate cyclase domain-containing protein [Treponema sp.]|nr:adenylate/guanylate cyclase domain-containing protein [Treponema sp.]